MDSISGQGLSFYPLYWVHHDCWQHFVGESLPPRYHWGHVHFFMLSYTWKEDNADAFLGRQTFSFTIKDLWGPRSLDPNQALPYTVVGTPKWYWNVQETWRRVYIQKWDELVKVADPSQVSGRRGIRWDACNPGKTLGPFREGSFYAPINIHGARTLPVEYFKDELRLQTSRDNLVSDKAEAMINEWNGSPLGAVLPREFDPANYGLDFGFDGPDIFTYPDSLYIGPTIEYVKVTQLNWERMPTWEGLHDKSPTDFGDGWENTLSLPFIHPVTKKYNSPFGGEPGVVAPFGNYFGTDNQGNPLVDPYTVPRYRLRDDLPPQLPEFPGGHDFLDEPFGLPAFTDGDSAWTNYLGSPLPHDNRVNLAGTPMKFRDPYGGDGKWVQQFIGGQIQVKAEVTIQHRLGGQETIWITATQMIPEVPFSGTDQSAKP